MTRELYTVRFYPVTVSGMSLDASFRDKQTNFPYAMLHDPDMGDASLTEPTLEVEINRSGQFTFTASRMHPLYNDIRNNFLWEAAVFRKNQFLWGGRPIQRSCDLYGNVTVVCEGISSFLSDVYVPPFYLENKLPSAFFGHFIDLYNQESAAVSDNALEQAIARHRMIKAYDINGFDKDTQGTARLLKRYTEKALPVMEILQTRLIDYFGGHLWVSMASASDHLWDISWLNTSSGIETLQCTQKAEIGVNLKELSYEEDWTDFATALVPTDKNGSCIISPLENDVTSAAVPDGTPPAFEDLYRSGIKAGSVMFYNLYLRKQYGLIAREYTDFTGEEYQEQVVGTMLNEARRLREPKKTIEAKVLDLSMLSGAQERFSLGKFVRVYSKAHALDEWMLIRKMQLRLDDPAENAVTLTTNADGR